MTNSISSNTINNSANGAVANDMNELNQPSQVNQLNEILNNADFNMLSDSHDTIFEDFSEGYYIGMMSGTSLDGMDTVIASFNTENLDTATDTLPIKLVNTHSKDFDLSLKTVLLALCQPNGIADLSEKLADNELNIDNLSDDDIIAMSELDWFGWASRAYGEFASEVIFELLEKAKVSTDDVLAIGCHGQTVRHRPKHGFTLQLVDPNIIAERTGISVVSDFRRRDMAAGGQGAPLVPAFHQAMFSPNGQSQQNANMSSSLDAPTLNSIDKEGIRQDGTKILLNLGGISNITVLPAPNSPKEVIGYDTGPANLLIDAWTKQHIFKPYDENGNFARSGQVIESFLQQLLEHPFFALPAPKSTGREDFHIEWLENQLDVFSHHQPTVQFSPADVQATLTELTAITASQQINIYTNTDKGKMASSVYVCGGGAYNGYLLERLAHHLPNWKVTTTDDLGLSPTWVEALAFAWLARQSLMGEAGNLPAVTGARASVVLGQVCFG